MEKFLRVFSRIFLRFPSTPHLAKPMLSAGVFLNVLNLFKMSKSVIVKK
ncbi:Uncharacterised protein [Chryseobacterium taklimakanense]|uniref:Uncharacterized protein n=1 Tax=Chryseobacterium taklimakanense TaxID=536441 RepID=A0A239WT18_9FLAO|nr:Uncharacterised protein [Chryseobacterium taklimakanense]